jgi:carboxylesterase type B
MTTFEQWMLGLGIVGAFCSFSALIVAIFALHRKTDSVISPQPLAIQLVEELHEQFAGKQAFEDLARGNTERHGQIFAEIRRVEKERREDVDARFIQLEKSRNETMEKLNDQFTFIRENIAAINRELEIRSES